MPESSYGIWSIVPPLVAIGLAIATRRVFLSLLIGIFIGALILEGGDPFAAIAAMCEEHLWTSLADDDHLRVFVFTLMMGALVGVIYRSGGMQAVVEGLAPLARSRRGGQLMTWLLGLIVFFDDYANSLLLGSTMRPLADRLKISREKLAYLVDTTAAPVSGLALVSTWVATEINFIDEGLKQVGHESLDGFQIFVATIPYRFYVLWSLALVPFVAWFGRDLGPMARAEARAITSAPTKAIGLSAAPSRANSPWLWTAAIVPIVLLVALVIGLLIWTGRAAVGDAVDERSWMQIFGEGDSYLSLVYASLVALAVSMLMAWWFGALNSTELSDAALDGARHVYPALMILWFAWTLSGMTVDEHLGTGTYLGTLLETSVSSVFLPTVVFLLASFMAFATGTSWGTMGILMPLVVRVTVQMLGTSEAPVQASDPILLCTVGSVLAGAIFGDHCSPISDTTVLSSQASGCDHVAHVRTQLPYALLVAALAVLCGTLPIGYGVSVWVLLPIGLGAAVAVLLLLGRRPV